MANAFSGSEDSDVEYSVVDYRIRQATIKGRIVFDEDDGTADPDWLEKVVDFIERHRMNIVGLRRPPKSFVIRLAEEGALDIKTADGRVLHPPEQKK